MESIRELAFFKTFFAYQTPDASEEIYYELCANMKHEFVEMGNFVFREGDPSNGKFYVILSGEVGVVVYTQVTNIFEKEKEHLEAKRRTALNLPSISHLDEEEDSDSSIVIPTNTSLAGIVPSLTSIPDKKQSLKQNTGASVTSLASVSTAASVSLKKLTGKLSSKSTKLSQSEDPEDKYTEYREMIRCYGNLARVLGKGTSFGESGNDM